MFFIIGLMFSTYAGVQAAEAFDNAAMGYMVWWLSLLFTYGVDAILDKMKS